MKTCSKCLILQGFSCFHFDKNTKDGYYRHCKDCRKSANKKYFLEHHKEMIDNQRLYNLVHKDKRSQSNKKWRSGNLSYQTDRRKVDIQFRLSGNLRFRLNKALKGNYKAGSAVKDLGCSIEFLKKYLEDQFQEQWTWDNYGKAWEIDHIIPVSSVNLQNREELLKICHYTNLRPLDCKENKERNRKWQTSK